VHSLDSFDWPRDVRLDALAHRPRFAEEPDRSCKTDMSLGPRRPTEDLGVVALRGGRHGTELGRAATPLPARVAPVEPAQQFLPISRAGKPRSNSDVEGPTRSPMEDVVTARGRLIRQLCRPTDRRIVLRCREVVSSKSRRTSVGSTAGTSPRNTVLHKAITPRPSI
jgi:hypothetical protein